MNEPLRGRVDFKASNTGMKNEKLVAVNSHE